jgi:YD repeat-containing protein
MLPPYTDLPDINALVDEGKNPKPAKPQPELKPPTLCGYRDVVCKRIKEKKDKEKKVGQQLAPGPKRSEQMSAHAGEKRGGWLRRLGRAVTGAFSGLAGYSPAGNSFLLATNARPSLTASAPPPPPTFGSVEEAKLDPRYRTGGAGEDLFSGNFHFSLPLLSLPGRNGLDVNLTLHYNSLVWIRHGNTIEFDYDYYPTLTPGFRLGFPELSGPLWNGTYMAILPTGRRVSLHPAGTNKYEAIDSSYLYLDLDPDNNPSTLSVTLYTTDGTQFIYTIPTGDTEYRCTKVRDSNGNFITVSYVNVGTAQDPLFSLGSITDALGRVITFNYQSQRLLTITQAWQGQTFTWAQFDYGTQTIQTNFSGLSVLGPANGAGIPVITRVITGDGARHTFVHNEWGQVKEIWRYGEADNQRAAMVYAFPSGSTPQSDCPRFTQRNDGIAGWAGQSYVNGIGWVNNYFYFASDESYGQVTTPDGVTHKQFFSTVPRWRGLPTTMETWHGGVKKKWTTSTWVSDSASFPLRPRVTETNVRDESGNRRRTTVEYTTVAGTVKLPHLVREYNADATTIYRSAKTLYLPDDANYTSRRIIGLPTTQQLYQGDASGGGTLVAQTGFAWDSPNDGQTTFLQPHSAAVRQHESAADGTGLYGTGFLWRGNLTKTLRYSVVSGTASNPTETKTGYYITGSIALAKDALNHQTSFLYDDSFTGTATPGPATWAYPTRVTDPDGYSSAVKYHYDHSAVTEAIDPKNYAVSPTSPPVKTVNTYDAKGRLERAAVWQNNAEYSYTRYVYGTDHNWAQTWTKIDTTSEETYVLSLLDGAGRERITISEHPGSAGLLKSQYRVFDLVGRVSEWSNPTEVYGQAGCGQPGQTACWTPWGDDATGYKYSTRTYDWNNRPLLTTSQDLTTRSVTYTGCGCAGGQTVEYEGEEVTHDGTTGRRKGRESYDSFGRVVKTELLNWSGTIYSSTTTDYNVRDQVTFGRAYQNDATIGTCPAGTCQETKLEYDGYGRLWRKWLPLYKPLATDPTGVSQYDEYEYFDNDLLKKKTDPRGATTTYGYNNRDLVMAITYGVTGSVAPTPNVTFSYDQAGNRLTMDDGPGTVTYNYNLLGEMTSESRTFDQSGDPGGPFTLSYEYNLAGQVKKITDPWNNSVSYTLNKTGEVTGITGTGFADINQWTNRSVSNFAAGVKYRAWGRIKEFSNGNFAAEKTFFSLNYDAKMQLTRFQSNGAFITNHTYYADGQIKDVMNDGGVFDFDRHYSYDHAARLTSATTNNSQAGGTPYHLTYGYDVWGNTTSRTGWSWSNQLTAFTPTYSSSRHTGWTHDAAGHVTDTTGPNVQTPSMKYDAAGRLASYTYATVPLSSFLNEYSYDGDGQRTGYKSNSLILTGQATRYYHIRSSVLGGAIIAESYDSNLWSASNGSKSYVYLNGERIAYQKNAHQSGGSKEVIWVYRHPVTNSLYEHNRLNYDVNGNGQVQPLDVAHEFALTDPTGGQVALVDPGSIPPPEDPAIAPVQWGFMNDYGDCYADGVRTPCSMVMGWLERGYAVEAPWGETGLMWNPESGVWESANGFVVDWDNGFYGFVPQGATYGGDGTFTWPNEQQGRPKLNTNPQRGQRRESTSDGDGPAGRLRLIIFFTGINNAADTNPEQKGSRQALPELLPCLGFDLFNISELDGTENFRTIANSHNFLQAMSGRGNKTSAKVAADFVREKMSQGLSQNEILIVAHSNGTPTANLFFNLMGNDFRVGHTLVIAPNTRSLGVLENISSHSVGATMILSNRDEQLTRFGAANRSFNSWQTGLSRKGVTNFKFIQTNQKGHGVNFYSPHVPCFP